LKNNQLLQEPLSILAPRITEKPDRVQKINKGTIFRLGKAVIEVVKMEADIEEEMCNLYQKE
jgi:hypothetical protein